jgi:hypothetical protein
MKGMILLFLSVTTFFFACNKPSAELFVETESFADKGGWVVDRQFTNRFRRTLRDGTGAKQSI